MTLEQKQVKDWMTAFGQECPEKPTIPSLEVRKLRAKLILEEALETIWALGLQAEITSIHAHSLHTQDIAFYEHSKEANLLEIADGCEDLKVVTDGTLVACGLVDIEYTYCHSGNSDKAYDPFFDEVMRSNWTKLWTQQEIDREFPDEDGYEKSGKEGWTVTKLKMKPEISNRLWLVKNKDGKVIKSPSYNSANLQPIINELNK